MTRYNYQKCDLMSLMFLKMHSVIKAFKIEVALTLLKKPWKTFQLYYNLVWNLTPDRLQNRILSQSKTGNLMDDTSALKLKGLYRQRKEVFDLLSAERAKLPNWIEYPPLVKLKEIYALDRSELYMIMAFLAEKHTNDEESSLFGERKPGFLHYFIRHYMRPGEVAKVLSSGSKLRRYQIITDEDSVFNLDLVESVSDYLATNREEDLFRNIGNPYNGPVFDLRTFSIPEEDTTILKSLLDSKSPCQILFYGEPGTGKTSLAVSLVSHLKKNAYLMETGNYGKNSNRMFAMELAALRLNPESDILIIDEADSLLNNGRDSLFTSLEDAIPKSWLTLWMEQCPLKVIWIVNINQKMLPSIKRRFSYSLKFYNMNENQRYAMWNHIVEKQRLQRFFQDESIINQLAKVYPLNSGSIDTCLKTWKFYLKSPESKYTSMDHKLNYLHRIIQNHLKLVAGLNVVTKKSELCDQYSPKLIETDVNLEEVKKTIRSYFLHRDTSNTRRESFNILLSGPPGTGKTEWVKHLAESLGYDLVVKRASDILGMYVGQTERQIAAMFREAEKKNCILFIDEAESLFFSRSMAMRSWEISHTNELLAQMERFNGVLVCATNYLERMDHAVLRRFVWKISFKPLTPEKMVKLLRLYFYNYNLREEDFQQVIDRLQGLTPGDIRSVYTRFKYRDDVKGEDILAALEQEVAYKQTSQPKKVGFA